MTTIQAAAVAATLACVGAIGAPANASVPMPGCMGIPILDAAGDSGRTLTDPNGAATASVPLAAPYMDITRVFVTQAGDKTLANIEIADLAEPPLRTTWSVWYRLGIKRVVLTARYDPREGVDYSFIVFEGGKQPKTGATSGEFVFGVPGVVSIAIPALFGGAENAQLHQPFARTAEYYLPGVPVPWATSEGDRAPDAGYGSDATIGCAPLRAALPAATQPVAASRKPSAGRRSATERCRARARRIRNSRKRRAALKRCAGAHRKKHRNRRPGQAG